MVTASIHINLGIEDSDELFAALRLVRCEAALLLALSASSPFLNGRITGAHSQRWLQFPLTPARVPLFLDHQHFITWTDQQIQAGAMHNVRHLWTSVRPNGPDRPHRLNRIELRICDLITDPEVLIAVTALLELRVQQVLREPEQHDPLRCSALNLQQLEELSMSNDRAAARCSLEATLHNWRDGRERSCRVWLEDLIDSLTPLAEELGLKQKLGPLGAVLTDGNQAMRWLEDIHSGESIESVIGESIKAMRNEEMRGVRTPAERTLG